MNYYIAKIYALFSLLKSIEVGYYAYGKKGNKNTDIAQTIMNYIYIIPN
ncbi:MAG: hypothetical protein RBS13_06740 [Bacteroidales bacterium]|nr:hypothetical protein [Bacteroidales bacterium]MDY0015891.1 hypothetical protein [Bacteroidales bacterium]